MLHWFSGTVGCEPGIIAIDGNKEVSPDVVCQLPTVKACGLAAQQ